MNIIIFIIIGLIGGLIGGMGMGGGTLLIPLLVLFSGLEQHVAQAVNLIAFIPMSVFALIIHAKNKLIDFSCVLFIAIPACITGILSSLMIKYVSGANLSRYFGIFLIILGLFQLYSIIQSSFRDAQSKKRLYDLVINKKSKIK